MNSDYLTYRSLLTGAFSFFRDVKDRDCPALFFFFRLRAMTNAYVFDVRRKHRENFVHTRIMSTRFIFGWFHTSIHRREYDPNGDDRVIARTASFSRRRCEERTGTTSAHFRHLRHGMGGCLADVQNAAAGVKTAAVSAVALRAEVCQCQEEPERPCLAEPDVLLAPYVANTGD